MDKDTFILGIESTFLQGVSIIKNKNQDYAGVGDPWKNFKSANIVGVDYKRAILVRVMDKISRISNLLEKEPAVVEESVNDTLIDTINYLAILLEAIKFERKYEENDPF